MGRLIMPFEVTSFPSKLIKGELYGSKSFDFNFKPLKRAGYIISAALPPSTITLFHIVAPDSEGDQQCVVMGLGGSDLVFLQKI